MDCPTREQRAWVGDSVVHQMVHHILFICPKQNLLAMTSTLTTMTRCGEHCRVCLN
jgi:urease alpha subunit